MKKIISLPQGFLNLYRLYRSKSEITFDEIHILNAAKWLLESQRAYLDQGYAHSYHFFYGWQAPYPETTGYIIPTLLEVYKTYPHEEFYNSAKLAVQWLKRIQNSDGSFSDLQANKQVFDTGQILIGFNYLHEFFPEFDIHDHLVRCATWLCSVQKDDGSFQDFAYNNMPHTYYSRVGSALLNTGKLLNNSNFTACGKKNIEWTMGQQLDNGFFKYASFDHTPPYLHTMIYILEGLLESYKILQDEKILNSILLFSEKLLEISSSRDLILFSQYNENYEPQNREKCITGLSQWAGVCLELFEITKNEKYNKEALKNIYYLKSKQIFSNNKYLNGGLTGSLPIHGKYLKYSIPNWGMKFFIDTLLIRKKLAKTRFILDEERSYIGDAFKCQALFNVDEKFIEIEQIYLNHIKKIVDNFSSDTKLIVDVGAGGGELIKRLQNTYPEIKLLGIDPVYTSDTILNGDFYNIPLDSNSVDVIICKEVLQHSGNILTALNEIKRVLKKNGILIIIERNPISFLGLRKRLYEKIGKWMYPPDSPFREKWYFSWKWKQLLTHFGEIIYLKNQNNSHGRKIFMNKDNRFLVIGVKNDK